MSLTADAILLLAAKGFTVEEIADVARANAAPPAVKSKEDRKRELARERQARYAERKRADAENVSGASEPRHSASAATNADASERQENVSEMTLNPAPLGPPSLSPGPPNPPPYNPPSPENQGAGDMGDMFGGPPPPPAKAPKPKRQPTRLPEGWTPSPIDLDFAEAEGLSAAEAQREGDRFRDYWTSSGRNAAKADWPATWRNWIRRVADDPKRKNRTGDVPSWEADRRRDLQIVASSGQAAIGLRHGR